jgi:hypothetical protein
MRETREPSRALNRSKALPQVLLDPVPVVIESEHEPAPFTHLGTIGVTPSHGEGLSGATPIDLDDPDAYTADPGPTLTMSGPKDGNRSANGMGGTRAVG